MYSNMLGLEMNLQAETPRQNLLKHPHIMGFTQQQQQQIDQQQTQLSMKQPNYAYNNNNNNQSTNSSQKTKIQSTQFTNSDEDEPNCSNDQENNSGELKRKSGNSNNNNSNNNVGVSPWQRMKWTDNMVRLLIMAVYYIGDESGGSELGSEKKKPGCGGGALQKKGKWKSVSRAMMEKGFYVSPQQCEDKFNDLNKRYKRVNDILGKGTACKVVENQNLLDSMDLSPKMKEEVKKLLNSKHLFFREMCAYHNSCGHAGGETVAVATVMVAPVHQLPQQQQQCLHSGSMHQHPSDEDDDDEDEDEDEDDDDNEDDIDEGSARKKAKMTMDNSRWSGEVMRMLEDESKSKWEKNQWMMKKMVELEENGVKIQGEALELEKERLKWIKFSSKKERELEKLRLLNHNNKLHNDRMLLLLRKQELHFLFLDQHNST
ncbi:hypothetical protein RND81_04G059900 [Saponaria officinalis]